MNPSMDNETDAYEQYFMGENSHAQWQSSTSLFVISNGINDMVRSYSAGWDYPALIPDILDVYAEQVK